MKYFLKHITQLNLPIAILLSVGCVGFWVPDFLQENVQWGMLLGTLGLAWLNGCTLVFVMYQSGITRKLEGLSCVLYLLLIGAIPMLHGAWLTQIVVFVFQLILLLVMRCYRNERAMEPAFLSSLLLCSAALVMPDLLFLLPVLWLMLIVQRAMNMRVWLASLIGASVVGIYTLVLRKMHLIALVDVADIWVRGENVHVVVSSLVSVVGLFFVIVNLMRQNIENTAITVFVWCLMLAFVPCAILMWLPPAYFASLMGLAVFSLVALAAYFFSSRESVFAGVVFIVLIALWVGEYCLAVVY